MKLFTTSARLAASVLTILLAFTFSVIAADGLPVIVIQDVPLPDAIRNLARQAELNYLFDPHAPGSEFGPGRLLPKPSVSGRWTNATAQAALIALLKEHKLVLVTNPATTVARIVPIALGVKPLPEPKVIATGKPVASLGLSDVSLTEAITQIGGAAGLKISFDPKVTAPAFAGQGTVSFDWRQVTLRQALTAILENYGLAMVENAATSTARISLKPEK
jgi:hypothetical protein